MRKRHWFLPDSPDLIGQLGAQLAITVEGLEMFVAWAEGKGGGAAELTEVEHRADSAKRELLNQIREAFITPIAAEDLFALSRGIDWILDYARDLVREAEAMGVPPDARLAEMGELLLAAVRHLGDAIGQLEADGDAATAAADSAIKAERAMERIYYQGMAELLQVEERQVRIARRELYRRCERIGEVVVDVGERIVYAVVKES